MTCLARHRLMKADILRLLNVLQVPLEKIVAVRSHAFNKKRAK